MTGAMLTTMGLSLDMVGAVLVASEVVKTFKGPTTIDGGDSGTLGGGFSPKVNPEYTKYEKRRRGFMGVGLVCLLLGFAIQIVGAWVS
ncbi:hypothetical protein [Halomonas cerina]|uniref:Uncharacterized protein n=1 Tax=Halomonas cerina TaxID=447424 RepID=A0A839V8P0_9GAMM|nr:hypothetical protein [Halomonas cerina]MBB3189074.1 hypothetical protein [Halomonas cerina]